MAFFCMIFMPRKLFHVLYWANMIKDPLGVLLYLEYSFGLYKRGINVLRIGLELGSRERLESLLEDFFRAFVRDLKLLIEKILYGIESTSFNLISFFS